MTHQCYGQEITVDNEFVQAHLFSTSNSGQIFFEYQPPVFQYAEECTLQLTAYQASHQDLSCDDSEQTLNYGNVYELNPEESYRTYSTVWANDAIGIGHATSMIDSEQGWSAREGDQDKWMQIDAGEEVNIAGLIVQSRVSHNQYVKALSVKYSTGNDVWNDVQDGEVFYTGNFESSEEKEYIYFDNSVNAKFIKIKVQDYNEHPSMRAGLLVSDQVLETRPVYNTNLGKFYYLSASSSEVKLYLQASFKEFIITELGQWDCNEYEETQLEDTDTGESCALRCAQEGFFMAAWNVRCFCEFNPESDLECDSFTDSSEFTTYKIELGASEENTESYYDWSTAGTDLQICTTQAGIPLLEIRALSCADATITTSQTFTSCSSDQDCGDSYTCQMSSGTCALSFEMMLYASMQSVSDTYTHATFTSDVSSCSLLLRAYSEIGEIQTDLSTISSDVGPVSYSEGVFNFYLSYPVYNSQLSLYFYLEPYILDPYTLEEVKTGSTYVFLLTIDSCFEPTISPVISEEFETDVTGEIIFPFEKFGPNDTVYSAYRNLFASAISDASMPACDFNAEAFELSIYDYEAYEGDQDAATQLSSLLATQILVTESLPALLFDLATPDTSQVLKQYWVNCDTLTWYDARDACQEWGGELVTIFSQEQADFIQYEILQNEAGYYWIGKWNTDNGDFIWQDGSDSSFDNKNDGHYDFESNSGLDTCVAINADYWPLWSQNHCDLRYNSRLFQSICYKDIENDESANDETGIANNTNQGQMAFRLLQDKKITFELNISQPISSISLGESLATTFQYYISVTPKWYCSKENHAYTFQDTLSDFSIQLKSAQTQDWIFQLPTLQYFDLDNSYCPITLTVKSCTTEHETLICDDSLSLDSVPAWDPASLQLNQTLSVDVESFDFYIFASTRDASGLINTQTTHSPYCDPVDVESEDEQVWDQFTQVFDTYQVSECGLEQFCSAKRIAVNIEVLHCNKEDIVEPELELFQEFIFIPGDQETLQYVHPVFESEFDCTLLYEVHLGEGLATSESTPIAYDSTSQTFTFTGSLDDFGLHSFDLTVLLEDLTEVGTYSFQLAIYQQIVEFESKPETSFDISVETTEWTYTLPSLAPGFEAYICEAIIESQIQQFIDYSEGTFTLQNPISAEFNGSYKIEVYCLLDNDSNSNVKFPDTTITINFKSQEAAQEEEIEKEPEIDPSIGQGFADILMAQQQIETPDLFLEPFVLPASGKKPQPPSILKKVQTSYFSPQLTINLRKPLVAVDSFSLQNGRRLSAQSSPSLLQVSYISQNITDDTANMDTFKWNITNVTDSSLSLSFDFIDPGAVSLGSQWDWIFVEFIPGKDDFGDLSQEELKPVREMVQVPPQIEKEVIETIEGAGESMTASVSVMASLNFVLKLILASSMERYMSMVNIMQIFVLYGLFEVSLTPQITSFFSFIVDIATFEILPEGVYNYDRFFDFNTETEFSARFGLMSFDSTSFIKVLGFLFIVLCYVLSQFAVLGIFKLIRKCEQSDTLTKKLDKWIKKLSKELFWNTPLAYVIESFLDICLACGLFMLGAIPGDYHYGDFIDSVFCWFFLVMIIFVPLFVLLFMCKNKHNFGYAKRMEQRYKMLKKTLKRQAKYQKRQQVIRLREINQIIFKQDKDSSSSDDGIPEKRSEHQIHLDHKISKIEFLKIKQIRQTMRETEVLFENLDTQKPNSMSVMYFIFMVRRATIIGLIFFSPDKTYIQLQTVIYMQLFYTIWLCQATPYKSKKDNVIEIQNEALSLYILYFFTMLNDPSPSSATRTAISYSILALAGVILFINGSLMVKGIVKDTCGKNGSVIKCLRKTKCFGKFCNKLFKCKESKTQKKQKKSDLKERKSEKRKKMVAAAISAIKARRQAQQVSQNNNRGIDQLVDLESQRQANQIQPDQSIRTSRTIRTVRKSRTAKQKLQTVIDFQDVPSNSPNVDPQKLSEKEINKMIKVSEDLIHKTLHEDAVLYQDTIENSFEEPIEAFKNNIKESLKNQSQAARDANKKKDNQKNTDRAKETNNSQYYRYLNKLSRAKTLK